MNYSLSRSIEILKRTPDVLIAMLQDLSKDLTERYEGIETWSVYDIVGHLIHGEKTDWIPRIDIILSDKPDKSFEPFDRFAQFEENKERSLNELLLEFKSLRHTNIEHLRSKKLSGSDEERKGVHPEFGEVTISQLIAAWTVHDLNHLAQISRVMAKQYKSDVGPWVEYLRILKDK